MQDNRRAKSIQKNVTVVGNGQVQNAQVAQQPAQTEQPQAQPQTIPVSFDEWYLQKAHGRGWRPEMKEAIRRHLHARGFMKTGDFEKGLKDFGIKS